MSRRIEFGVIRILGNFSNKSDGTKRLNAMGLAHEHYLTALDNGDWQVGLIVAKQLDRAAAHDYCRQLNETGSGHYYFVEEV